MLLTFFFRERERQYYSLAVKIPFTIDETVVSAVLIVLSNGLTMMLPLTKAAYNHFKTYADFTTERFPTGVSRLIYGKSCLKVDIIGLCVQQIAVQGRGDQRLTYFCIHLLTSSYVIHYAI